MLVQSQRVSTFLSVLGVHVQQQEEKQPDFGSLKDPSRIGFLGMPFTSSLGVAYLSDVLSSSHIVYSLRRFANNARRELGRTWRRASVRFVSC